MNGRIREIMERLDAAHPGPWRLRDERIGVWGFVYAPGNVEIAHALQYKGRDSAPLIAHARSDIEYLLRQVIQ